MKLWQAASHSSVLAWTRFSSGWRRGSGEWAHRRPRARWNTALLTVSFSGALKNS